MKEHGPNYFEVILLEPHMQITNGLDACGKIREFLRGGDIQRMLQLEDLDEGRQKGKPLLYAYSLSTQLSEGQIHELQAKGRFSGVIRDLDAKAVKELKKNAV